MRARLIVVTIASLTGCSALIGVRDLYFEPDAASPDAEADRADDGSGSCGDASANRCVPPELLADRLDSPNGIAMGPAEVYVTAVGNVFAIPKAGGAPRAIVTETSTQRGVALE